MPNDSNSTDRSMESFFQRKRELEAAGMGRINASETAILEERIKSWPSDWGDDLRILIYGDFELPDEEMHFDELGITVHPEKLEKTVIGSALTVLSATVEIPGRSIQGLLDATRRINVLLGSLVLIDWGNPSCGWWSWVTHGPSIGLIGKWKTKELNGGFGLDQSFDGSYGHGFLMTFCECGRNLLPCRCRCQLSMVIGLPMDSSTPQSSQISEASPLPTPSVIC